jgi:hypothetical protein
VPPHGFDVLAAVYVADALIDQATETSGCGTPEHSGPLDEEYLASLGVADEIPAWQTLAAELIQTALEEN